jgi:hypothetical protein
MGCPVYDWHQGDDPERPVHVVYDEDNAAHGDAAYCGTAPGTLGWVVWIGDVPQDRRCSACYANPRPVRALH